MWGVCQLYSITYFLRQGIKGPLALPLVGTFIPIMWSVSMIIYAAQVWVCGGWWVWGIGVWVSAGVFCVRVCDIWSMIQKENVD